MTIKFGVSIPTCREGLNLPLPFASAKETVQLAVDAEALGFDSAWGNDHVTAPAYVRADYQDPPRFYEPLTMLAAAAALTRRIRLGTGVLVAPMREPVYLAKQLATLDHLSDGRLTVGLGTGAYREEFEALFPDRAKANRGQIMDEVVAALQMLFTDRTATYAGEHVRFDDVELWPKPVQAPLPIYFGGNSPGVLERVGSQGHGWIAGALAPEAVRAGRDRILATSDRVGREAIQIDIAPQYVCSIAKSHEQAAKAFRESRFYLHLRTLSQSTLRGQNLDRLEQDNLVGTPDEISARIALLADYGVTNLAATVFVSENPGQMREAMQLFAEEVMANFQ